MAHFENSSFVVGIDIGSAYSGYAFASRYDFQADPPKISINVMRTSHLLSLKFPTAILFNAHQEFVAFGYEAESKFSEFTAGDEYNDYYYFRRFKHTLHQVCIYTFIQIVR